MSNDGTPARLFVAVPVPEAIQRPVAGVIEPLRARLPGRTARWVSPHNLHLTLRFIGACSPPDVEAIRTRLGDQARRWRSCTLRIGGTGCFPNERAPRVLWLGVDGDLDTLGRVQTAVEDSTRPWGRREGRTFHPHVTLARVGSTRRSDIRPLMQAFLSAEIPPCPPWPVRAVHLMQSVLAPGGSHYSTLATFELGGSGEGNS